MLSEISPDPLVTPLALSSQDSPHSDSPVAQDAGESWESNLFLEKLSSLDSEKGGMPLSPSEFLLSIFQVSVDFGISDIHFVEGEESPVFRVARGCVKLGKKSTVFPDLRDSFESVVIEGLSGIISDFSAKTAFSSSWRSTFSVGDRIIRAAFYMAGGRKAVALRILPRFPRKLTELGFTTSLLSILGNVEPGLVLISGGTSCGKSSTLASLVDSYSSGSDFHIRILEDAPEYEYHLGSALITRQQIGKDVANYSEGVESCLVHDVNVLVFGELRDVDSIKNAIFASTLNMLVIATIHAPDVSGTVSRLLEAYEPSDRKEALRQLSSSLKVVVAQKMKSSREGDVYKPELHYESCVFRIPSTIPLPANSQIPSALLDLESYSKISSSLNERKSDWQSFGCKPF